MTGRSAEMIRGIGIDMTDVTEIARLAEMCGPAFLERTFTVAERDAAASSVNPMEYLAVRFAAKEAVFKAIGDLSRRTAWDFRDVETLSSASGAPCVRINESLRAVLEEARVDCLHLSATTEGNYAAVIALATYGEHCIDPDDDHSSSVNYRLAE